jgi:hypothetical protein
MRLYPVLALVSSALALAACGGGGGSLSSGPNSRVNVLGVCAIQDTSCVPSTGGTPTTPSLPDSDGDGVPDDQDNDGGVGSGAGGNTTGTNTGTRTVAIQSSKLDKPTSGPSALAILTSTSTPTQAATEAAILSTNKPKTLKFAIDTKSAANSQWAVPIEQTEYEIGTRDLTWIDLNHTTGAPFNITDEAGNPVTYNTALKAFTYSTTHTFNGVTHNQGTIVDTTQDFYWNQLLPYMGDKANGGAKGDYREYRAVDASPTVNRDEVLQVWDWGGDSYSAHYVNRSGEDPKQHAWTFGGKAATNMRTSGSASYRGRFVATAKTANWIKPDGSEIDPNATWRVQGRSELTANFGTNDIRGTLTSESWTSYQDSQKGYYTWFTQEAANTTAGNEVGIPSTGSAAEPNFRQFYDAQVTLSGKIKPPTTTSTGVRNSFDGTATLSNPYISSNNPMYGGFFGTNGTEVTGVFSVSGTDVSPIGGSTGLIGDRAGYLDMNGSFNANCTVDASGQCVP